MVADMVGKGELERNEEMWPTMIERSIPKRNVRRNQVLNTENLLGVKRLNVCTQEPRIKLALLLQKLHYNASIIPEPAVLHTMPKRELTSFQICKFFIFLSNIPIRSQEHFYKNMSVASVTTIPQITTCKVDELQQIKKFIRNISEMSTEVVGKNKDRCTTLCLHCKQHQVALEKLMLAAKEKGGKLSFQFDLLLDLLKKTQKFVSKYGKDSFKRSLLNTLCERKIEEKFYILVEQLIRYQSSLYFGALMKA